MSGRSELSLIDTRQPKGAAMRPSIVIGLGLALAATPCLAAGPTGEWLVENGSGQVHIENCGGALWGAVSWEDKPGRDTNNPDPSLRGRPTLGIPILIAMRPATVERWGRSEQRWEGHIYNVENGKLYEGSIRLSAPNTLRIEGCVLGGLFCGGQDWTRAAPRGEPATVGQAKRGGGKTAAKSDAAAGFCSRVPGLAGRTH
jgi:uncharacterized protein (DUF2147 family)